MQCFALLQMAFLFYNVRAWEWLKSFFINNRRKTKNSVYLCKYGTFPEKNFKKNCTNHLSKIANGARTKKTSKEVATNDLRPSLCT